MALYVRALTERGSNKYNRGIRENVDAWEIDWSNNEPVLSFRDLSIDDQASQIKGTPGKYFKKCQVFCMVSVWMVVCSNKFQNKQEKVNDNLEVNS